MKRYLSILLLAVASVSYAQPDAGILVESMPINEPALTTITNDLGATPYSWRVYATVPDDYEVQIVYGDMITPMSISTTGSFYQDALGGGTTLAFNQAAVDMNPELGYDSWLTIGASDNTNNLIMLIPEVLLDDWEAGNDLMVNDLVGGGVFITTEGFNEQNTPDAEGKVLIAQVTATADVDYCFNYQIRKLNPDGSIANPSETWQYTFCGTMTTEVTADCPGDFDGSGFVSVPDLLLMLVQFGCTSNCDLDLTGDDKLLVDDFLVFLSLFGNSCD